MAGRRGIRLMVPAALVVLLVWLMVGCFYVPTSERVDLPGTRRDFRPLVGGPGDVRPIAAGRITRSDVVRLLGPPRFTSAGGHAVAYVMSTRQGLWIWPLCFYAGWNNTHVHVLKLVYDGDRLQRLENVESNYRTFDNDTAGYVIDELNRSASPSEWFPAEPRISP